MGRNAVGRSGTLAPAASLVLLRGRERMERTDWEEEPQDRPGATEREPGASDGGETTFHGKAENPHPKGRPKPGKFRRGPPADAVRALHPARATGQRQSVVPEMPPVPQEGPLTRPGATNAGRDTFFLPYTSYLSRSGVVTHFQRAWSSSFDG